jgi:hypothetical protein
MSGTCLAALALVPVFRGYAHKNFEDGPTQDVASPTSCLFQEKKCPGDVPKMSMIAIAYVHVVLLSVMAFLESPWLFRVLGRNPWTWCVCFSGRIPPCVHSCLTSLCRAADFLTSRPSRLGWAVYWIVILGIVTQLAPSSTSSKVPNIVIRKYFHGVAVLMFAPVIVSDVRTRDVTRAVTPLLEFRDFLYCLLTSCNSCALRSLLQSWGCCLPSFCASFDCQGLELLFTVTCPSTSVRLLSLSSIVGHFCRVRSFDRPCRRSRQRLRDPDTLVSVARLRGRHLVAPPDFVHSDGNHQLEWRLNSWRRRCCGVYCFRHG